MNFTITDKQVGQLLVMLRFCRKVFNQLATGQGISYNISDMMDASNGVSIWISELENALDE